MSRAVKGISVLLFTNRSSLYKMAKIILFYHKIYRLYPVSSGNPLVHGIFFQYHGYLPYIQSLQEQICPIPKFAFQFWRLLLWRIQQHAGCPFIWQPPALWGRRRSAPVPSMSGKPSCSSKAPHSNAFGTVGRRTPAPHFFDALRCTMFQPVKKFFSHFFHHYGGCAPYAGGNWFLWGFFPSVGDRTAPWACHRIKRKWRTLFP